MTTLKEYATAYVPTQQKTLNICELPKVSTNVDILNKEGKTKDGTPFKYNYIVQDGIEYRVPQSVIEQLQALLKVATMYGKTVEFCKVTKTGTGMETKYKVEPVL